MRGALLVVMLMAVAGCKSEGRKATNDCLEAKGLERAEKCSFACSTYNFDEASKESCPAAIKALDEQCVKSDKNEKQCKELCRTYVNNTSGAPKGLKAPCARLTKY